jgi:hypothetical protein
LVDEYRRADIEGYFDRNRRESTSIVNLDPVVVAIRALGSLPPEKLLLRSSIPLPRSGVPSHRKLLEEPRAFCSGCLFATQDPEQWNWLGFQAEGLGCRDRRRPPETCCERSDSEKRTCCDRCLPFGSSALTSHAPSDCPNKDPVPDC